MEHRLSAPRWCVQRAGSWAQKCAVMDGVVLTRWDGIRGSDLSILEIVCLHAGWCIDFCVYKYNNEIHMVFFRDTKYETLIFQNFSDLDQHDWPQVKLILKWWLVSMAFHTTTLGPTQPWDQLTGEIGRNRVVSWGENSEAGTLWYLRGLHCARLIFIFLIKFCWTWFVKGAWDINSGKKYRL